MATEHAKGLSGGSKLCVWVGIMGGRGLRGAQPLICAYMHIHQNVMAELLLLQRGAGGGGAVWRDEDSRAITQKGR